MPYEIITCNTLVSKLDAMYHSIQKYNKILITGTYSTGKSSLISQLQNTTALDTFTLIGSESYVDSYPKVIMETASASHDIMLLFDIVLIFEGTYNTTTNDYDL